MPDESQGDITPLCLTPKGDLFCQILCISMNGFHFLNVPLDHILKHIPDKQEISDKVSPP